MFALHCIVLYCTQYLMSAHIECGIVLCYETPIHEGRLDRYRNDIPRELSELRTQPWLSEGSLTCDPCHHRDPSFNARRRNSITSVFISIS